MESKCLRYCKDKVTIIDYYGESVETCKQFASRIYIHPCKVIIGKCSETILGVHPCNSNHHDYLCHVYHYDVISPILITFMIFSFLILMCMRYLALRKLSKKKDCKIEFSKGKIIISHMGEPLLKYSVLRLVLYLTLGISLIQGCVLKSSNGIIYANEGDTICTNKGNFTIPITNHALTLIKNYDTADWEIEDKLTWSCVGGTCPYVESCIKSNSNKAKLIMEDNSKKIIYSKDMCKDYPGVCVGGRGCIFGSIELVLYNSISVFTISSISNTFVSLSKVLNCSFEIFHNTPDFLGEHSILSINNEIYWYCPNHSPQGLTLKGILGDLQIQENKSIAFDWDSLRCGENWYDYHCNYKTSFISNLKKACLKLPSMTPLGYLNIVEDDIMIEYKDDLQIKTNCNNLIIIKNPMCFNVYIELWGIRSHSTGIYIAYKADSKQKGSTISINHPCKKHAILTIQCDGKIRYQRISEMRICKKHNR